MWPRISKFSRAILAVLTAGAILPAYAADPAPDPPALLKQLTPDHLVNQNSLISATGGRAAPAELLGFNLETGGQRVVHRPLAYTEGCKLEFDLYWIPREMPRDKLSVRLRISGSGPAIEQVCPLETSEWKIGVVSRQRVELKHARGLYSGKALLTVGLRAGESKPEYVMYTCPVFIATSNYPSKVDQARLRQMFGDSLVPLNKAFRIGEGASTAVVSDAGPGNYRGLVIVSSTGYDGAPAAGEPVCRVEAAGELDATLVAGRDTAPSEPGRYDQIGGKKLPAKVFSRDGGSLDFVTVLDFGKPCRPGQITFKYLKDKGVLSVKELALLKTDEPK